MGNFDLYGNSYKTATEAMNAEMAQCAEIDLRHMRDEIKNMQRSYEHPDKEMHDLWQYCQMLEQRIEQLEKKLTN